jgi:hypothetical protein
MPHPPTTISHHRVRTYSAHALILFKTYGLPLSSGIWLEYYFTSLFPSTSLLAISSIFATQLACLGLATLPAAYLYRRYPRYAQLQIYLGLGTVCGGWLGVVVRGEAWWVLLLCQGALMGFGLGVLGAVGIGLVSTHYKRDLGTVSTQCGTAGFAGAVVYTALTWMLLRRDQAKLAHGVTVAIASGTLLFAIFLARPCDTMTSVVVHHSLPTGVVRHGRVGLTYFVLLSATLFAPSFLVVLIFSPLLLGRTLTSYRADFGPYVLLTLYSTAAISSLFAAKIPPIRLSPTTLFVASTFLTGVAIMPIIWMPTLYIAIPCYAVFGVRLGNISTLWIKMLAWFLDGDGEKRLGRVVCTVLAVGGFGVGGGVVGAAAMLQSMKIGVEVVLGIAAGCLILGGLVVWAGATRKRLRNRQGKDSR